MRRWRAGTLVAVILATAAAAAGAEGPALDPPTVEIPAGSFVRGSDAAEREAAYRLDEAAYGHDVTRRQRWYEREPERGPASTGAYRITTTPVTNRQYRRFVLATGRAAPDVDRATWEGYRLIHPFERTRRHVWAGDTPPAGREHHPVVLVSYDDATAFADWLTRETGAVWRLPTEAEWEKAVRGLDGRRFPWGDDFAPDRLNSHDAGPFDTVPVGRYPDGRGPFGLLDGAGQVYEWTATTAGPDRQIVKGGSWDDKGCGVCRPAARHGRPRGLRHIFLGFRLVREP